MLKVQLFCQMQQKLFSKTAKAAKRMSYMTFQTDMNIPLWHLVMCPWATAVTFVLVGDAHYKYTTNLESVFAQDFGPPQTHCCSMWDHSHSGTRLSPRSRTSRPTVESGEYWNNNKISERWTVFFLEMYKKIFINRYINMLLYENNFKLRCVYHFLSHLINWTKCMSRENTLED